MSVFRTCFCTFQPHQKVIVWEAEKKTITPDSKISKGDLSERMCDLGVDFAPRQVDEANAGLPITPDQMTNMQLIVGVTRGSTVTVLSTRRELSCKGSHLAIDPISQNLTVILKSREI